MPSSAPRIHTYIHMTHESILLCSSSSSSSSSKRKGAAEAAEDKGKMKKPTPAEKRLSRLRERPTQDTLVRIERALSQRLYLVHRQVQDEHQQRFAVLGSTDNVYEVVVWKQPACTGLKERKARTLQFSARLCADPAQSASKTWRTRHQLRWETFQRTRLSGARRSVARACMRLASGSGRLNARAPPLVLTAGPRGKKQGLPAERVGW